MNLTRSYRKPVHIAVIGGGFCGTFFAAQLAHYATEPIIISIVEPRAALGGGLAYSTPDPAHRINVASTRMILFPDDPENFDHWLRRSGVLETDLEALWRDGKIYPRRAVFGRYIREILEDRRKSCSNAQIIHVRHLAVAINKIGLAYNVKLDHGEQITADIVVLANSHPPPAVPAIVATALEGDPGLIADPLKPDVLNETSPNETVLIIGTGLTMADVVATLSRRGHTSKIIAFSRRGLLPRGHIKEPLQEPFTWFGEHYPPDSISALLRQVRSLVADAAKTGTPWQAVFDDLRLNGQKIWCNLDKIQRRRFLRHLRVFWDAHRYRIAPQVESVLQEKCADRSLRVSAASLDFIGRKQAKIEAVLRPRHSPFSDTARVYVDRVIVTTGPNHAKVVEQTPVLRSLEQQGLLRSDCLGLGIKVNSTGQVIKIDGTGQKTLLVVGPLAREQYGELMGMPQVSEQPDAVARYVAQILKELPEMQ